MSSIRKITTEEISLFKEMLNKLNKKAKTKGIQRLRCAIYARKSTKDETETSISAQISYCRRIVESCEMLEEAYVFQEDDVSGMFVDKREQFLKMFELVATRQIDVIICYRWDRFARRLSDCQSYMELARSKDVYILSGDDVCFVHDASSLFSQTIYQATSELFARKTAETMIDSLMNKAREGYHICGQPPIGYRKNSINKLEINLEEAIVVNKIFSLLKERKNLYICC